MTRFARAKGSKSSNEKAPEDGTPWEVMKEQLLKAKQLSEDAKKREEAEKQRIENYENFLKEHKVQKRKATWCDFPEAEKSQNNGTGATEVILAKKKNKNKQVKQALETNNKQIKTSLETSENVNDFSGNASNKKVEEKKGQNVKMNSRPIEEQDKLSLSPNKVIKKNKKMKRKINLSQPENTSRVDTDTTLDRNTLQISDRKPNINKNTIEHIKKKKKYENGQHTRRKVVNDNSFQFIINGKEIELVRFDGFPIMKKDAERLQELKTNMMNKGIPKSEVQRTMKLERRRAEKALARLKREVCYNCRKGGHNLSDCPDLKSKIPGVEGADGMCFKCGSTEHRQFECKVQRDKEFRFATCFICKEQGHIARQCPDNPKGMYPNGGCCKLCGDVTHLRKDCPTDKDKKEVSSVKLETLDSTENIEDIGQKLSTTTENSRKPKKIKF